MSAKYQQTRSCDGLPLVLFMQDVVLLIQPTKNGLGSTEINRVTRVTCTG